MFKYVLSLTLAGGLASAATISTSATCDGVTTFGTTLASCNKGHTEAHASASQGAVSAEAQLLAFPPAFPSAGADYSDTYVFTVTGGTGQGSFYPCFSFNPNVLPMSVGQASAEFGGIFANPGGPPCTSSFAFSNSKPFTFGIPQIVGYSLSASGFGSPLHGAGSASVASSGIQFFDPVGNLLSNVNFTLVSVPEPSALSMLSIGLMFLLAVVFCGAFMNEPDRESSRFL